MTLEELISRFVDHTGVDEGAARAAFFATADGFGASMAAADARAVAESLGASELAERVRDAKHGTVEDFAGFNDLVAAAEGVDQGRAVEHAQVAAQILAEAMSADELTTLRSRLPATVADLLEHANTMRPPPGLYDSTIPPNPDPEDD